MSSIKNAIISAAGMGTRLGLNIPKCLLKFNGISIIEHQLKLLKDIESVRVVVGFMEEDVIKTVKFFRNDVIFVRNPDYQKNFKYLQYKFSHKKPQRTIFTLGWRFAHK